MTFEELCDKYKYEPATLKPNKLDMPLNIIPNTEEGMQEFNEIVDYIHSLKNIRYTPMTKSGGISFKTHRWIRTYNIKENKSSIELLLLFGHHNFRWEFRRDFKNDNYKYNPYTEYIENRIDSCGVDWGDTDKALNFINQSKIHTAKI